ncbi:MAG: S8 family serine peptidase [Myxococcales bacterium]|nr:S8 family serine peptidase [Myxococcales bacterium]
MLRRIIPFMLLLFFVGATGAQAAWVDPNLTKEISENGQDDWVGVYVVLQDQVDLRGLLAELKEENASLARRHYEVITALQEKAAETQPEFLSEMRSAKAANLVKSIHPFWIANAVALTIKPTFLNELKDHPDISSIFLDYQIELITPVAVKSSAAAGKGVENGITVSRAPELWNIGIDGTGRLACDQDTGADSTHPAFGSRWRGNDAGVTPAEAWFDPVYNETTPSDSGQHGTHTLGTILGDDGGSNQIGMAPGAKWIGAKTIDTPGGNIFTDAVAAFEWAADPDENPSTMDDVPDVVNNSWGLSQSYYGSCRNDFNASIVGCEAAGVTVVFAAGNEGSSSRTLRSPGNQIMSDVQVFSIAALNQDGTTAASFSSRGPSDCDGTTIKPEVSAVGVDVRSAMPGGGYQLMSGTSMATPHVAGAVVLLKQAYPEATPEDIKTALYMSAVDLGTAGEDNTFGRGRIDMIEAYNWLTVHMITPDGRIVLDRDGYYSCDDIITITVTDEDLTGASINVNVASTSVPAGITVALAETSNAHIYRGTVTTVAAADLDLADGDTITATYIDANDGNGHTNVTKTDTATADCLAPTFAGLQSATPGDYQVVLGWNAASDLNPVVYYIYRSLTSGVYAFDTPLASTSALTYTDETAENGTTYYYVVRAADTVGNEDDNTIELDALPVGPDRLFTEDWDSKAIGDWEIVNGGCSGTWTVDNPGERSSPYWQDNFVIADCSTCIFGNFDDYLTSPSIDTRHYTDLELRYSHEYWKGGLFETVIVDISADNGTTWTQLKKYNDDAEGEEALTLPATVEGRAHFKFRYHYGASALMGYFWGIDNIEVTGWPDGTGDDDDDDDTAPDDDDDDNDDASPDDDDTTGDDDAGDDDVADDDAADDDAADDDNDSGDDDDNDDSGCGC